METIEVDIESEEGIVGKMTFEMGESLMRDTPEKLQKIVKEHVEALLGMMGSQIYMIFLAAAIEFQLFKQTGIEPEDIPESRIDIDIYNAVAIALNSSEELIGWQIEELRRRLGIL